MNRKYWLVTACFALAGVGWLLKPLKQFMRDEAIEFWPFGPAIAMFTFAIVFYAAGRKASLKAGS